jgi:hypothetical protein
VKLWPALGGLNIHHDVARFWSALKVSGEHAGVCEVNTRWRSIPPREPCTPFGVPRVLKSGGEGTCGLRVHARIVPSPVFWWRSN